MKFGLSIPVEAHGVPGNLGDAVDLVVAQLANLDDSHEQLLDFGVGSDATGNTVVFDLTVEATGVDEAFSVAWSCLRSAVQAAGGSTPGWENVTYELSDTEGISVRPLERVLV